MDATNTHRHPKAPLVWRYRIVEDNKTPGDFKEPPSRTLIPIERNHRRIVQLVTEKLAERGAKIQIDCVSPTDGVTSPAIDYIVGADVTPDNDNPIPPFEIHSNGSNGTPPTPSAPVEVTMNRTRVPVTKDDVLSVAIRASTNALSVNAYVDFMDALFVDPKFPRGLRSDAALMANELNISAKRFDLASTDSYRVLSAATELFVLTRCGVVDDKPFEVDTREEEERFGTHLPEALQKMWHDYLEPLPGAFTDQGQLEILPYINLVRRKLGEISSIPPGLGELVERQAGLVQDKLLHTPMIELVWSYWIEESMAVQSFNAVLRRFQNLRPVGERDPLAALELSPLQNLGHILWDYAQSEQNRLSVLRRAHQYEYQYGFTLQGKALADLNVSDRRSKFLESFHNLLLQAGRFYALDDNTTVHADAFPLLNAIKETHYLLSQGMHNQFGNLAMTARKEMLTQLWILSRSEMREFLGTRAMVAYPEPWMDRVDSIKTLKGWTDTSVVHFRDLAVFGEQLLLSIRLFAWSDINNPDRAANWARYWRAEVQGYIHGYRAATGVDLTTDATAGRQADSRFLAPSILLRNRLLAQGAR
jgi:hypothetical protein